jgi:hypothetical protein
VNRHYYDLFEEFLGQRGRKIILSTLFASFLFAVMVWGTYTLFTSKVPGANDFYPRWKGAQLFWQGGIDPYSQTATEAIQRGLYGRLATPDEDQVLFVYPFYTIFLLWPLISLDYAWVQAIWLVLVQFSIIGGVILGLRLVNWPVPLWLLAVILLWSVIFYNSTRTIILGQFAGPIFLGMIACLLALKDDRDGLAGVLLSWTTLKPQMSYLLIPALLLWAIGRRRWRFVAGFGITLGLLVGISFILLPNWLTSFVDQVGYYPDYTITGSPLWVITGYYWPQLGKPVETVLIVLLVGYLLWQWRRLPGLPADSTEFLVIISLTLIITNMIIVRTATTNYIIMYLPLLLLLKAINDNLRWGKAIVTLIIVLSAAGMWLLFLTTLQGDSEHPITYLPLPFALLFALIWGDVKRSFPNYAESREE